MLFLNLSHYCLLTDIDDMYTAYTSKHLTYNV